MKFLQQSTWSWVTSEFMTYIKTLSAGIDHKIAQRFLSETEGPTSGEDPETVRLTFDRAVKTVVNGQVAVHESGKTGDRFKCT